MAFTHGMNVEEVRAEGQNVETEAGNTESSRSNAEQLITNFVAESWWGTDADQFLEKWNSEIITTYTSLFDALEVIGQNIKAEADQQEECSAA